MQKTRMCFQKVSWGECLKMQISEWVEFKSVEEDAKVGFAEYFSSITLRSSFPVNKESKRYS